MHPAASWLGRHWFGIDCIERMTCLSTVAGKIRPWSGILWHAVRRGGKRRVPDVDVVRTAHDCVAMNFADATQNTRDNVSRG